MKLPPNVAFHSEFSLFVWKPRGILDEKAVNQIINFIGDQELSSEMSFNRFTDATGLEAVDLNFDYVFHVGLFRRLSYAGRPRVKSAFLVEDREAAHYFKLHLVLTDHSPLRVRIFGHRKEAAKWLDVPIESL